MPLYIGKREVRKLSVEGTQRVWRGVRCANEVERFCLFDGMMCVTACYSRDEGALMECCVVLGG